MSIRIYTSENCEPCARIKELVARGKMPGEIELVDIETDEGFLKFKEEVLNLGDGAVPSAYKDGKRCKIMIDEEENLTLDCPSEDSSSE